MNNLVSVVIVTRDRKRELVECINFFLKSSYKSIEIIVVDNASKVPLESWLPKKFPKVKLITSKENLGAAGGRNEGIKYAKGNYLLFPDDDAVVDKETVGKLVSIFGKDPEAGAVQPIVYDKKQKKLLLGAGHRINLTTSKIIPQGVREKDSGQYEGLREVEMCGTVWMTSRSVIKKIGYFDEDYFIPYEDSDFCIRAKRAGFRNFCFSEAKAWHQDRKTTFLHSWLEWFGITSKERAFRVARNKLIFMRKHSPFPNWIIFLLLFYPLDLIIHFIAIFLTGKLGVLLQYLRGVGSGIKYWLKYEKYLYAKYAALFILIPLTTFIAVGKSFDFSLFGDDWIVFYGFKFSSGPGTSLDYTSLKGYFGPYTFPHYFMALISHFLGYAPRPYFIASYLLRVIFALGASFLIMRLTKNFFATLVTGLLASVVVAGIETTNWVFNMPTYLALFFSSLSLVFLLDSKGSLKKYLFAIFFLILSVMMFPQRMHGLFIVFGVALFFEFPRDIRFSNLFRGLFRLSLLILTLAFLIKMRTFGSEGDRQWFFQTAWTSLLTQKPYFWVKLITTYGKLLLPDYLFDIKAVESHFLALIGSPFFPRTKLLFLVFSIATGLIFFSMRKKKKLFLALSLILGLTWTYYLKLLIKAQVDFLVSTALVIQTFFAGYILIWLFIGFLLLKDDEKHSSVFPTLWLWPLLMLLVPWARMGFLVNDTLSRYMVVPGIGIVLILGYVISLSKSSLAKLLSYSFAALLLITNLTTSRAYFDKLMRFRSAHLDKVLWDQLRLQIKDYRPSPEKTVFYFEGDYAIVNSIFTFGFPPRMGIYYDVPEENKKALPFVVETLKDLNNEIYSSSVPAGKFYAFRIEGEKLIDIKPEVLAKFAKEGRIFHD